MLLSGARSVRMGMFTVQSATGRSPTGGLCLISVFVTLSLLGDVMCEGHPENTLPLRIRGLLTYGDTVGKLKIREGAFSLAEDGPLTRW